MFWNWKLPAYVRTSYLLKNRNCCFALFVILGKTFFEHFNFLDISLDVVIDHTSVCWLNLQYEIKFKFNSYRKHVGWNVSLWWRANKSTSSNSGAWSCGQTSSQHDWSRAVKTVGHVVNSSSSWNVVVILNIWCYCSDPSSIIDYSKAIISPVYCCHLETNSVYDTIMVFCHKIMWENIFNDKYLMGGLLIIENEHGIRYLLLRYI